jgi:hypothetical protein
MMSLYRTMSQDIEDAIKDPHFLTILKKVVIWDRRSQTFSLEAVIAVFLFASDFIGTQYLFDLVL